MEVTFEQRKPTYGLVSGAGAEEGQFKSRTYHAPVPVQVMVAKRDNRQVRCIAVNCGETRSGKFGVEGDLRRGYPQGDSSKVVSRESCQTPE